MEKTRDQMVQAGKRGNGTVRYTQKKSRREKNRRPLEKERLAEEGGTVGKNRKLPVKKETFIQQKTFLGNKGEGAVAKPEREGDKREYNKKKRSLCPVNRKCGGCQFWICLTVSS